LVEINRAHFRGMREEGDYLYQTIPSPFSQQVPQTLSGLSASACLMFFDSHPLLFELLVKNTEHRYECDNKR